MYSGGRWTGIGNCDVTINESYLIAGIKYKITEKKNLSASMSTDKSRLSLDRDKSVLEDKNPPILV